MWPPHIADFILLTSLVKYLNWTFIPDAWYYPVYGTLNQLRWQKIDKSYPNQHENVVKERNVRRTIRTALHSKYNSRLLQLYLFRFRLRHFQRTTYVRSFSHFGDLRRFKSFSISKIWKYNNKKSWNAASNWRCAAFTVRCISIRVPSLAYKIQNVCWVECCSIHFHIRFENSKLFLSRTAHTHTQNANEFQVTISRSCSYYFLCVSIRLAWLMGNLVVFFRICVVLHLHLLIVIFFP